MTAKPLIFLSHITQDASIAAELESFVHTTLLGGVELFNTSNRESLRPGDPWRDSILLGLRTCAAALVVATPESVNAPWINFESGGAWVSEKRVIPCCAKGMTKSSLPAPLSHLQALEIEDPEDLEQLIHFLATVASLNDPEKVDYIAAAERLRELWSGPPPMAQDEELAGWIERTQLRPQKYKDTKMRGTFILSDAHVVSPDEQNQFSRYKIAAGISLRLHSRLPGVSYNSLRYCFINDPDADLVEDKLPGAFEVDLTCMGTIRVESRILLDAMSDEEDRVFDYFPAYLLENVR